jgi:hypothetical protein
MSQADDKAILQELESKREEIILLMLAGTTSLGSEAEQRQFVAGYFDLILAAARGDLGPRDAYLETVIPGIKQGGLGFDYVLAQMAAVGMAVAAVVSREHVLWHMAFTREYVSLLVQQWNRE